MSRTSFTVQHDGPYTIHTGNNIADAMSGNNKVYDSNGIVNSRQVDADNSTPVYQVVVNGGVETHVVNGSYYPGVGGNEVHDVATVYINLGYDYNDPAIISLFNSGYCLNYSITCLSYPPPPYPADWTVSQTSYQGQTWGGIGANTNLGLPINQCFGSGGIPLPPGQTGTLQITPYWVPAGISMATFTGSVVTLGAPPGATFDPPGFIVDVGGGYTNLNMSFTV